MKNEFTDRVRMEILPELESRLRATRKIIRASTVFTIDYKAGVKDTILCAVDMLNEILDNFDKAESALNGDNPLREAEESDEN